MTSSSQHLLELRRLLTSNQLDALIVPREDEYLGEYIPAHNERLRWVSGFNGSAGVVIVLPERAAIFVDGRYTVQVRQEVSADCFEYHHLITEPPVAWLAAQLSAGARVGCDPRLHSSSWYDRAVEQLASHKIQLVASSHNLIDQCWFDRPPAVVKPALLLETQFTGETSEAKRRRIGRDITAKGADAAVVFAPDSVSWLLNIRGRDIPCLPVVQSAALLAADGSLCLLINPARVPEGFSGHVGEGVEVVAEADAERVFARYKGVRVFVDATATNAWMVLALQDAGATLVFGQDPVILPKAAKNAVEIAGAKNAHVRDAVAEVKFLHWLDTEVAAARLHNEAELADKLLSFREPGSLFEDSSFATISAAGSNAAMCHYNHRNTTPAALTMDSVYLVDSGAQYRDGTTDITRTVAIGNPGDEARRMFTLVLKGHIALAQARFPQGTNGTQLDALARQFLWREGYDYDHGTGHGVGAFLSVHEGPQRIAKQGNTTALLPGMIISNEPGYYRDGVFGIRCENLVVVREVADNTGETAMLEFETITVVPFDQRMLMPSALDPHEVDWLNRYHARVYDTVSPLLAGAQLDWLQQATRPIVSS